MVPRGVNDMDNVHRDYLLARFREERNSIMAIAMYCTSQERLLIARHFDEIEYQIRRAFDDAAKAQGGAS
jgi:hypothetical protein